MDKFFLDTSFEQQENARHLETVTNQVGAQAMSFYNALLKSPEPYFHTHHLAQLPLDQTKLLVNARLRITHSLCIFQAELDEERLGRLLVCHMDKDELGIATPELIPELAQFRQGFFAEYTTKMTQENK